MFNKFSRYLRQFREDNKGSVAVEVAVILPVLLWAFVAMWVFFDAYKTRSVTEKAAYTISDMLSRETSAVDASYLASARKLFDLLSQSDAETGLRVTVVSYSLDQDDYKFEWSNVDGNIDAMDGSDMTALSAYLPVMAPGETLIIVETTSTYEPPLNVGIGDHTLKTFIFTRPRFAPQLIWSSSSA